MRLATFLLTLAAAAGQPLPARVEGRVVSTTGEALPKAVVYLIGYERPLPGVQTDAVGKFVFEDVTPGWYTLSCIRNGFVTQKYRAALNLTPGTELKGFVIHMTQEAAINGRVTDQDGDPVRGADVYVQHPSYPQGRRQLSTAVQVITNDQGYYRAAGLAPGRYYVKAEARHAVTASERKTGSSEADLATYFPSALDETDAKPLDLESGGQIQGIDLQLRRGRVYSIRGKTSPPERVVIKAEVRDASGGLTVRTVQPVQVGSGAFEFFNIAPGTYVLRTLYTAGPPARPSGSVEVTVAGSSLDGIVLPLFPPSDINGTVTLENEDLKTLFTGLRPRASPPPSGTVYGSSRGSGTATLYRVGNAMVEVPVPSGQFGISLKEDIGDGVMIGPVANIERDGTFRIQGIGTGERLLDVAGLPENTYVKSVKLGDRDVTHSPIDTAWGGKLQILLSAKAADVVGTVRDDKGNPIGGAAVALWPKMRDRGSVNGGVNQAYTDQNGLFKFTSLAPGDYYIAAWEDLESGLAQNPEFLSHFNSVATAITLQESAHVILDPKVIPPARLAAEIAMLP